MPRKKRPKGDCVYCGEFRSLTRDHVPPRNLFGRKPNANLVTVPCCSKCNGLASKDDEYFRRTLALRHDVSETPIGKQLAGAVFRSLRNPKQKAFTQSFLRGVKEREAVIAGLKSEINTLRINLEVFTHDPYIKQQKENAIAADAAVAEARTDETGNQTGDTQA